MDNNALKGSGPSFIADLARMGGDVEGSMTQAMLKGSGPSFPPIWLAWAARLLARRSAARRF